MKKVILVVIVLVFVNCLLYMGCARRPSQEPEENEAVPSENWKEYRSMVKIWPRLKNEGIESIRFCNAMSLEYGYDTTGDFCENVKPSGFRERAAEVVRWWHTRYKVPKENLPECIRIIDEVMKKVRAKGPFRSVSSSSKMLIVTKKGNYIVHVGTSISEVTGPKAYGHEWESRKLGEFLVKYCMPADGRILFVLPEERPAAILIFSDRKCNEISSKDSLIAWPPVVLFGDKEEAEKILDRSFEPKMTFEGSVLIDKIIDMYKIAMKDAAEKHYRGDKNAEEKHHRRSDAYAFKGWIVFLTQDEFYWGGIDIDESSVYGSYIIESKQLKAYFDELGLTEELLAGSKK